MSYLTPGSSKVLSVHISVFSLLLKAFFCMRLRTFDLEKLMQLNFRERFTFWHKGPKLEFSLFFQKMLPSDF